ncbi:MAG: metal-dependent transcriptional regulator [Clostridia bacterium]|nr:metal-dependent transcriptional regulator [Clostridia bacterium]MDD4376251.1 metal-dependent transcriptional regulator [Clostridia bacterium]
MYLTNSLAEYLKAIYVISKKQEKIRVTDIADMLGYAKPSVNRALKNLKEINLINFEPYKDIKLTDTGIKISKKIMKSHSTLKFFLTELIGIEEDVAETEATSIKTYVSEDTILKLEQYINTTMKLGDMECNYDGSKEKCRNCLYYKMKQRRRKIENAKN